MDLAAEAKEVQMEETRKRKRGKEGGEEHAFVDITCANGHTLCISVQNLDVLCKESDGFRYLLQGHPAMKQQLNLSLFQTYGVALREACILMFWAEHKCFLRSDKQLERSVSTGALREACVSLGGGFSGLLSAAYQAVAGKPTSATYDLQDEYEWRIVDLQGFECNNAQLDTLYEDGWVFVEEHSSSSHMVKRFIFHRKRVTSMKTE